MKNRSVNILLTLVLLISTSAQPFFHSHDPIFDILGFFQHDHSHDKRFNDIPLDTGQKEKEGQGDTANPHPDELHQNFDQRRNRAHSTNLTYKTLQKESIPVEIFQIETRLTGHHEFHSQTSFSLQTSETKGIDSRGPPSVALHLK